MDRTAKRGEPPSPATGVPDQDGRVWFRTKLDLFSAVPTACSENALLVAEDVINLRKKEVVKRYAAADTPEEYLDLLGVFTPSSTIGYKDPSGACRRLPRRTRTHRYEIVQGMETDVFAFFDVDSRVPKACAGVLSAEGPMADSEAEKAAATDHHASVEKQVRADLEAHFGLEPGSPLVALSRSHTSKKASVHAVVRFRTTMTELAGDVRAIRSVSPLGSAYDDIYNKFRCFRAIGSSKHPGASEAPENPVLSACECGPTDPVMHIVRPPRVRKECDTVDAPGIGPCIEHLPDDCPARRVRAIICGRTTGDDDDAGGGERGFSKRARGQAGVGWGRAEQTSIRELFEAATESGLASDIGVDSSSMFAFDSVVVSAKGAEITTRAELSKRSFVCPGKMGYHSSNRALLILTDNRSSNERVVKFVCLDSQCRADNRNSVLIRKLAKQSVI